MNPQDQNLAHALKIRFGTFHGEPNEPQLILIIDEISAIIKSGKQPTNADWHDAVHKYCPSAGKVKYAGADNADLNTLLALAVQVARGLR